MIEDQKFREKLAEVEIESPDAEGVIFAQGGRFGGHALFLKDRRAHYVYNFLGVPPEQLFSSDELAKDASARLVARFGMLDGAVTSLSSHRADVRLRILDSRVCPTVAEFGLFLEPK